MTEELAATEAVLNITFAGLNGTLLQPVHFDSSDEEIKSWATEAVNNGDVPGITTDSVADFNDFVVDRFPSTEDVQMNRISLRPKVPFGK